MRFIFLVTLNITVIPSQFHVHCDPEPGWDSEYNSVSDWVYKPVCSMQLSYRTVHDEDVSAPCSSAQPECSGSCVYCTKASGQLKRPGGLKHTEQGQRTRSGSHWCHLSQLTFSLDCLHTFAFITATFIQLFITSHSLVKSRNPRREAVWKSATERARRQSPACFMLTSRCHVE